MQARVEVEGRTVGSIDSGLVVLLAVHISDTEEQARRLAAKIAKLRIFEDEAGRMNLSCLDVGGGILAISQFTLYGDASAGNRPSFIQAARPEEARPLYELFLAELKAQGIGRVEMGRFGARMEVAFVNDGPTTIIVEQ